MPSQMEANWRTERQGRDGQSGTSSTEAKAWDLQQQYVTAIAETLKRSKGKRILILSDSKAAIAAVVKAGKRGRGRIKELREAADLIARRCIKDKTAVCLSWIKRNIGIEGNEAADETAKRAAEGQGTGEEAKGITLITEGGVRQKVSGQRRKNGHRAGGA